MHTESAVVSNRYVNADARYPSHVENLPPPVPECIRLLGQGNNRKDQKAYPAAEPRDSHRTMPGDPDEHSALAGGIAHNFNNLLMGINGYVELMLLEPCNGHHRRLLRIREMVFESSSRIYTFLDGVRSKPFLPAGPRTLACTGHGVDILDMRLQADRGSTPSGAEKPGYGKMASMASGVVKDLHKRLNGIQDIVAVMRKGVSRGHVHFEPLAKIEKLVARGADMIESLIRCTRKIHMKSRSVRLDHLVTEVMDTFSGVRKGVRIHHRCADDPREVMADPGLIEQILQNLYLNAADAMPCGGDLFLDVKNLQGDRDGQGRDPAESYVLLTVRDTGSGMDAQTAKHIFEPFFTTKGSRGKGLGLASVYSMVKAHRGRIAVDSMPGNGTTFRIYLPAKETPERPC